MTLIVSHEFTGHVKIIPIAKGVTEAHGGEVSVESDDKGTIFKIKLPMDARKAAEEKIDLH